MTEQREKRDIYADITDQLITAIEAKPGEFELPWRRNGGAGLHLPSNIESGKRYQGINILNLWVAAEVRGFAAPIWGTYRQWQAAGAQVRKGEKASLIVFCKEYETQPDPDDTGKRRIARGSFVFNAAQVDGYQLEAPPPTLGPIARLEKADQFVTGSGAEVRNGGDRAFYRPSSDHIQMPEEGLFIGTATMDRREAYYATLVHELVHWTSHESRLARQLGKRFGDAAYAAEELVAEIGAAFLCAELEITQSVRPDHAQYLAEWLRMLKSDSKAIFTAAARANEAARYLSGLQATRPAAAPAVGEGAPLP